MSLQTGAASQGLSLGKEPCEGRWEDTREGIHVSEATQQAERPRVVEPQEDRPLVHSFTIQDMVDEVYDNARHMTPLYDRNLACLATQKLRLTIVPAPATDSAQYPHIVPLLDPLALSAFVRNTNYRLDPLMMPTDIPETWRPEVLSRPYLCCADLFRCSPTRFADASHHFYANNEHAILARHPHITRGPYRLTTCPFDLELTSEYHQRLIAGDRTSLNRQVWLACGGFYTAHGNAVGVIMGSKVAYEDTFVNEGATQAISREEILALLYQIMYCAGRGETRRRKGIFIPEAMIINFLGPETRSKRSVDLRTSVCENLGFVGTEAKTIIPEVWQRMLAWTFSTSVFPTTP